MNKKTLELFILLMCISGLVVLVSPVCIYAQQKASMVRVGLTERFYEQDSIQIKNTMLTCGYWSLQKNDFIACEVFTSGTGFLFTPFEKTCYISEQNYSSYDAALAAAGKCSAAGITAYPAIIHEKCWKVYITGNGNDCAAAAKLGIGSFSLSIVTAKYRILVSGKNDTFIIDIDDSRIYPMFAATSSNSKGDYVVTVGGKQYRGYIEIGRYKTSKLTAVNILPMEEYLYGVVPCEVSYRSHEEMLKAQAVAARSYAAAQDIIGPQAHVSSGGYSLTDTTASQVYGGYSNERQAATKAVDATKDEKIYYNGNVIKAYYFSTSGGSTEDAQAVWNVPIPYFKSVSDVDELSPAKKPWVVEYSSSDIVKLMKQSGYEVSQSNMKVSPEITTQSGRVYSLRIKSSAGTVSLSKTDISSVLDLPSTKFKVITSSSVPDKVTAAGVSQQSEIKISESYILSAADMKEPKKAGAIEQYVVAGSDNLMNYPRKAPKSTDVYYFAGMGYGHGIGMSQSGAECLAEKGMNYKEILYHYYTGTQIR